MSDEIIKVLDHISDKFGIAIDWSSANVMPYLQDLMTRMVKYVIYTNIVDIIFYIILIIGFIGVIFVLFKILKDWSFAMVLSLVPILLILIFGTMISSSINNIIEVNTVPEKYLIEMIQSNISNNNN